MVPIQPHGSLPPFFCVAGVGGNPMNLRHLAQALLTISRFTACKPVASMVSFRPIGGSGTWRKSFRGHAVALSPRPYYIGGYLQADSAPTKWQLLRERGEQVAWSCSSTR